ncbi:MAG TPA: GNAT family N-acetyltransferase, partial [Amycolatopsis sp.]|nr:GNAT family N-acetyltransferase [Amycolatopsis sp.]
MTSSQVLVSTDQTGVELPADAPRYSLLVAHDNEEVLAAQKLRHQVFADEMGARLNSATP